MFAFEGLEQNLLKLSPWERRKGSAGEKQDPTGFPALLKSHLAAEAWARLGCKG